VCAAQQPSRRSNQRINPSRFWPFDARKAMNRQWTGSPDDLIKN